MSPKSLESEKDILHLINSVKRYPCLFNKQHPNHHNKEVTQCIWQMIATKLEASEKTCKHSWKSLKRKYRRGDVDSKTLTKKLQFLNHNTENEYPIEDVLNGESPSESTSSKLLCNDDVSPSVESKFPSENHQSSAKQNNDSILHKKSNEILESESISLLEDDSDVEEIKPHIECIEIDSCSTVISDTDDADSKSINLSSKNKKNHSIKSKKMKKDYNIDDFSEFLKFVLDNCCDLSPSLLNEVKDGICDIMEKVRSKIVKKKRKK